MRRTIALKIVNTAASERELEGIRKYILAAAGKSGLLQIYHAGIEQDSLFYLMEAAIRWKTPVTRIFRRRWKRC